MSTQKQRIRFGKRSDGMPIVESTTYLEVARVHPLAQTVKGLKGHWVPIVVSNPFDDTVTELDEAGYGEAQAAWSKGNRDE